MAEGSVLAIIETNQSAGEETLVEAEVEVSAELEQKEEKPAPVAQTAKTEATYQQANTHLLSKSNSCLVYLQMVYKQV